MARTRTGVFKALYQMGVGEELAVSPDAGEDTAHLLKRLKARLAKWSKEGLTYRFKTDGDKVVVQRLAEGQSAKYADWWGLELGEALLLKAAPSEGDWKRAKAAENYINLVRYERMRDRGVETLGLPINAWSVGRDGLGRMLAVRQAKNSQTRHATALTARTVKEPWDGEWL